MTGAWVNSVKRSLPRVPLICILWGKQQRRNFWSKTESAARAAYLHFMGQATEEELLEQFRHGSKEGRILGNENFIKDVLTQNSETVSADVTIKQLVDVVAHAYHISPLEMTSASRSRHLAEARAMTALIGMDHCDYLLSNFAQYFNRDMPSMSKLVKAIRARLTKSRVMHEKMEHINNQITTIRKA
ncbi:MAG: hypothetical protein JRE40_15775 [Deltaproteobacteria bacterium]|nr:hypothetical protein [Deltaproteobacteria bacterium]